MRLSTASLFSAFVAMAMAYTQPDYSEGPSGNNITKPELNDQIPAGKPYTIEWVPTTPGPISLVLLRGPSTDVVPLTTIVEDISNSGSYVWTPSTDLQPDTTNYAILLVDDETAQFQWSTQFGISNPDYIASNSSSSSTPVVDVASTTTSSTTSLAASSTSASNTTATNNSTTTSTSSVPVDSTTGVTTSTLVVSTTPTTTPNATASSSTTPSPSAAAADRKAISLGAVVVGVFAILAF